MVLRRRSRAVIEDRQRRHRGLTFIAWGAVGGRSLEIAESLGGEARCFYPPGAARRPPVVLRYLLASIRTWHYLLRRRPEVVVVTSPPVVAPLVTLCCARAIGARVVIDSHPGSFGAQGDRVSARLQRLHRWLVRRAALCLVAEDSWRSLVESWGGTAVVVHEAPGSWQATSPRRQGPLRVLVVGRFGGDEPLEVVLGAARALPGLEFSITGNPAAFPRELRALVPPNARLVGFLDPERYRAAIVAADVVVTLTTEPASVMRAAYEAVYAGRPLVISDWPVGRALFPYACHVANTPEALAAGLLEVDQAYARFAAATADARALQLARWEAQRRELCELLGLPYLPTP